MEWLKELKNSVPKLEISLPEDGGPVLQERTLGLLATTGWPENPSSYKTDARLPRLLTGGTRNR
jgi:hypothetical protein